MLTFEKIRDMEREERNSKQLQKLPDDIIESLKDYLRRKEKIQDSSSIVELENIKSTIARLFELRQRKILNSALHTAKTGIPPENMMKNEEKHFYDIVDIIKKFGDEFFIELEKNPIKKEKKESFIVKKDIPEIMGPDMQKYKFTKDEKIEIDKLPKPLNDLLLKEGIIERVEE